MDKLQKGAWSILQNSLTKLTNMLYEDKNFTVQMYIAGIGAIINTDTFKKVSKQDLLEEFINKQGIIPIAQTLTYQAQQKSLQGYLATEQSTKRVYWQITLRLVKLRINCQKQIKSQIKLLKKEVVKLISTLRMILEQKVSILKSMVASSFLYAMKENCPVLFFDQAKKIFNAVELDLEYVIQEGKQRIIEALMQDMKGQPLFQTDHYQIKNQKPKKQSLILQNHLSQSGKSNIKLRQPQIKTQANLNSNKKQAESKPQIYQSKSRSKIIKKQSAPEHQCSSKIKMQQLLKSFNTQQSKKSTSRYIRVKPRISQNRASLSRTIYEQKKLNLSSQYRSSEQTNKQVGVFSGISSSKQNELRKDQLKKLKQNNKNKMTQEEEAKIKKMFIIHYERPDTILCQHDIN